MLYDNPFSTIFGTEPDNFIDRPKESSTIIETFSSPNRANNPVFLLTGLRGSGKTVFLSRIAEKFANKRDWIVVDPAIEENMLENVAGQIYSNGKLKKLFVHSEFNFSFHGIGISIEGKEPVDSVITLLEKMISYLEAKNKKLLITIDEITNSSEMKNFFQMYQYLLRKRHRVYLLMTGLYENVSRLINNRSLTFLYRTPTIQMGPLGLGAIADKYESLLEVDRQSALKFSNATKGFAFAYQLLGSLLYEADKKELSEDLLSAYDNSLAVNVYDKIFASLSQNEKKVVLAFSSSREKLSSIKAKTSLSSDSLSVYRDRLLKRGLVYSPEYGYLEFTLPRFEKYIDDKRNIIQEIETF